MCLGKDFKVNPDPPLIFHFAQPPLTFHFPNLESDFSGTEICPQTPLGEDSEVSFNPHKMRDGHPHDLLGQFCPTKFGSDSAIRLCFAHSNEINVKILISFTVP
jgi:hypothetical protein